MLLTAEDAQLHRKGVIKEINNLDINDDPDLQQLLDDFASSFA